MSNDMALLLEELKTVNGLLSRRFDDIQQLVREIDGRLNQLSLLRPDTNFTIVGDVVMRSHGERLCDIPAGPSFAACIRVPGGFGIALWRPQPDSRDEQTVAPAFLPFADVPRIIQRLILPHLEHLLESLPQKMLP